MPLPTQSPDAQRQIIELRATRPYDGRRVTVCESRGGWKFEGVSGVCTHLAADHRLMVLVVERDPANHWPIGMAILVELDHESVPAFDSSLADIGRLCRGLGVSV